MGKRGVKLGSGGAVSLYLPAEIRRLHDLAIMDPDIVPSNVYAMALRSVLGDSQERHPMEMMLDEQRSEIEQIEKALDEARLRLSSTESRLPGELARADWLRNLIGKDGLEQMKRLRVFLFFDAKHNAWLSSPIDLHGSTSLYSRPRNGKEALEQYRELVAMYESTKRGPVAGSPFEVKEHYHPEHLVTVPHVWTETSPEGEKKFGPHPDAVAFVCCEMNCESGRWTPEHDIDSPAAKNLCDDLKYRCDDCWGERQLNHKGLNRAGEKIPILKPHWEVEELTEEQVALVQAVGDSRGRIHLQTGVGYLQQEIQAFEILRKKAVIKWAMQSWSQLNPEDSSTLERLSSERLSRGPCRIQDAEKCQRCAQMGTGHLEFSWYGLPKGTYRGQMIQMMTKDERNRYNQDLRNYESIALSKGNRVSAEVKRWEEDGSPWPYAPIEDSYMDDHELYKLDEEDISEQPCLKNPELIWGSDDLCILAGAISGDISALEMAHPDMKC